MRLLMMSTLAVLPLAGPALADPVREADKRVAELRIELSKAERTRDAVAIAAAKARLDSARAIAWGARNPAPNPTTVAAR